MVIQVLVEIESKNVDKVFDYLVPSHLETEVQKGVRVLVPFGSRQLEGFVLEVNASSDRGELKEILDVVDQDVILDEELLDLGKYLQQTTLATLIQCYQAMLPKALKARNGVIVPKKIVFVLSFGEAPYCYESLNENQQSIVTEVENQTRVEKTILDKISKSSVQTLLKKGILKEEKLEKYRLEQDSAPTEKYPLTEDQEKVVRTVLERSGYLPYLLHGVTGSGKTEVYMELIEEKLYQGKTAIVLVPEISLTPQIVKRFKGRFGETVAILHSGLSDGEKYDEYRKIAKGEVSIVIGARSAVFAPLKNIGIIIVDEEHTSTYHQENNPRYHAIDIALYRGKYHDCPVVLGSATPTLESYARSQRGVYQLLELPNRVCNRPLPTVTIVDLAETKKGQNFYFSDLLLNKLRDRLAKGEQALLLLNRRGYATYVTCSSCGYTEKCPSCDISLTHHKTSAMLRCHYCRYAIPYREECSACHEQSMKNLGMGTERIEEELKMLLPQARVVRMDVDTTSRKGSHAKIINSFAALEYDILLGTQMIAKGLDFPNVTLVGVIAADTSLNIPDFRSSEATFQLLDQVAGRSGRGEKKGEVVIQTFNPDHYAITFAQNHNYLGFYQQEMKVRQQLRYSPYYYMSLIRVMSKEYDLVRVEATKIAKVLTRDLAHTIVLGPTVANMFKVNNVYHFQIVLKYKKEDNLYPTLEEVLDHYKSNPKISVQIDFNPSSFL